MNIKHLTTRIGVVLLAIAVVALYSCKKDGSTTSTTSIYSLLTSSPWTFHTREYLQNGVWIADPKQALDPQYTLTFTSANQYQQLYGGDYSNDNTWALEYGNTQLLLSGGIFDIGGNYNLTQLTAATLELTMNPYSGSTLYTGERITFTR